MQMHESMISKADKKSSKESPTLNRKNQSRGQQKRQLSLRLLSHPYSASLWS